MRSILETAVAPEGRVKLGSMLAEMGRQANLTDEELDIFDSVRDKSPSRQVDFE